MRTAQKDRRLRNFVVFPRLKPFFQPPILHDTGDCQSLSLPPGFPAAPSCSALPIAKGIAAFRQNRERSRNAVTPIIPLSPDAANNNTNNNVTYHDWRGAEVEVNFGSVMPCLSRAGAG